MPRVALTTAQRREYKIRDFRGWVAWQMKMNGKRQADVAEALGVSQARISQMLKIPQKGDRANLDPFSYGQVLTLCEYFGVDGEERQKLLTL